MPKEESDGSALGALLAPSAGLFAGTGIKKLASHMFTYHMLHIIRYISYVRPNESSFYSVKGLQLQQSLRDDETTSG